MSSESSDEPVHMRMTIAVDLGRKATKQTNKHMRSLVRAFFSHIHKVWKQEKAQIKI